MRIYGFTLFQQRATSYHAYWYKELMSDKQLIVKQIAWHTMYTARKGRRRSITNSIYVYGLENAQLALSLSDADDIPPAHAKLLVNQINLARRYIVCQPFFQKIAPK